MKDRSHDEAMAEQFQLDPDYAAELLAEVRLSNDPAELAILLRQLAKNSRQVGVKSLTNAKGKPSSK
jgi:DNA-binding phage protein